MFDHVIHVTKWAIRRNSDSFFMEQPIGRNGRGGSFAQLIDPNVNWQNVRLFHNKHAASIALRAWLKGEYHRYTSAGDFFGGEDPIDETTIVPQPLRDPADMEVVKVTVILPQHHSRKPVKTLDGAGFIGESLYGDNPNYPGDPSKVIKTSKVIRRIEVDKFETLNSIYVIESWVPRGRTTIPEPWCIPDDKR